jgi:adenylosuccinate synthase
VICRFQGGHNAGHTLVIDGEVYKLHALPSGVVRGGKLSVIGNGVVLDPKTLIDEIEMLQSRGVDIEDRLGVSRRAHLVLPYHKLLDGAKEAAKGAGKIGTTKRGIGPAYRDKISRNGLRVCDLADQDYCWRVVREGAAAANAILDYYGVEERADSEAVMSGLAALTPRILALGTDSGEEIRAELARGGNVLLEGAQGSLLDVDHGTYPFVTSSTTTAGGAAAGVGIGPTLIDEVLGVVKAYTTRVGAGPFPTELEGDEADRLRNLGAEFGATTGRPRRPGWFDGVVVRHAAGVNGLTGLAVTKLDVLDSFDEVLLGVGYQLDGVATTNFPERAADIERVRPVYEKEPGWKADTGSCRSWDELPEAARHYLRRIETVAEVPIRLVSVGSARSQIIRVG